MNISKFTFVPDRVPYLDVKACDIFLCFRVLVFLLCIVRSSSFFVCVTGEFHRFLDSFCLEFQSGMSTLQISPLCFVTLIGYVFHVTEGSG